jgi:hypothetical protein
MTRRQVMVAFVGGAVAALGGCDEMFRKRFRFRMTVEVETPQGLRSGSTVTEVSAAKTTKLLPEQHAISTVFKGEAVAVDLPGGTLFALVGDIGPGYPLSVAVVKSFDPLTGPEDKFVASIGKLGERASRGRSVPLRDLPKLVRFRDIHDPRTVELVDPEDLAKSFGPGVQLSRIVLTVVDEPVTIGIERRLRWLSDYPEPRLSPDYSGTNISPAATLTHGDFRKGTAK